MKKYLPLFLAIIILYVPFIVSAQRTLVELPDLKNDPSFDKYINLLYKISISLAALLAVVKIMIAGAKYMLTDIVTSKSEAKSDIKGALLGLLLIIGAVIILNTINPALTDGGLNITKIKVVPLSVSAPSVVPTSGGKTAEELASILQSTFSNACSKSSVGNNSAGDLRYETLRFESCSAADKTKIISDFKAFCNNKKGGIYEDPKGSYITCATQIDGAGNAIVYAKDAAGQQIINSPQTIGSQFVKQEGAVVTTNVDGACDNNVKDLPAGQKKSRYDTCVITSIANLAAKCDGTGVLGDGAYGIFDGKNAAAVTCQLPKDRKAIAELSGHFDAYKAADASRKYDTIDNLSTDEEETLCEEFAKGTYFDAWGSSNVCVFY